MAVLRVVNSDRVYPTKDTVNRLRADAAKQGFVVSEIRTEEDLLEATTVSISEEELEAACQEVLSRGMVTREEAIASLREQGMNIPDDLV